MQPTNEHSLRVRGWAALRDMVMHSERFRRWLPVVVLPPILVIDGALSLTARDISWIDLPSVWWSFPIAVVATLPLIFQCYLSFLQMAPLMVASVVLCLATFVPGNTVVLIPAWVLFGLARFGGRRETVTAAMGVIPAVTAATFPFCQSLEILVIKVALNIAICELALALGYAAKLAEEQITRTRERQVLDERLRIAREVHDVVAHSLVAINVQSGVAAHLADSDAGQARSALAEIRRTSAEALTDLRATLGLLRDPATPVRLPAAQGAEPSGDRDLSSIESLATPLRRIGVDVTVDIDVLNTVPPGVESAAYRIVQEALTNVMRHGEATEVSVIGRCGGDQLVITVTNNGPPTSRPVRTETQPTEGLGAGVRGMTERAHELGGTVVVGPHRDGWQVHALLPVTAVAASGSS